MRPFQTGTPEYFASSSTTLCLKPLNSIPSNMRPNTRAVSLTSSLWPSCMSSLFKYSGNAPSSLHATVNAQRVRVDGFSNISAIFLPANKLPRMPARFLAFKSAAKSTKYFISNGVKSAKLNKLLPFKLTAMIDNHSQLFKLNLKKIYNIISRNKN